jgi:trk system potassium uptake protein TrkH
VTATLGAETRADVRSILYPVIIFTGVIEFLGFIILAVHNLAGGMPWLSSAGHALFHSVSAFCNAGFSLHDDSLTSFQWDLVVNLVICGLIMVGGIGYPVMLDMKRNWLRKSLVEFWAHLQLNTRIMLLGSLVLWLGGTICFMLIEWDGVLEGKSPGTRLLISIFQSVTCRTAGFNTIDIGRLTNATLFVMIALMIIGAGPCSTGGGFKVTTFMTLVLQAWSSFRGYSRLNVFRRTIPKVTIERAYVTAMAYFVVAGLGLTLLLMCEQSDRLKPAGQDRFLGAAFEVVSALGTVGLSTGITPQLSVPGKLIIIGLMFVGRLGPITAFAALSRPARIESFEYSSEEPLLG